MMSYKLEVKREKMRPQNWLSQSRGRIQQNGHS